MIYIYQWWVCNVSNWWVCMLLSCYHPTQPPLERGVPSFSDRWLHSPLGSIFHHLIKHIFVVHCMLFKDSGLGIVHPCYSPNGKTTSAWCAFVIGNVLVKAIYNRLAHIHLPLVDLYSSILCLEEVPIVKCNKSWSSEKLSISINISTEWLAKIHFDIWEYKFYEKDCRCSAVN